MVIGPPDGGEPALVAALDHARPGIARHPYPTRTQQPGMMPYGDIQVQLAGTLPVCRVRLARPGRARPGSRLDPWVPAQAAVTQGDRWGGVGAELPAGLQGGTAVKRPRGSAGR